MYIGNAVSVHSHAIALVLELIRIVAIPFDASKQPALKFRGTFLITIEFCKLFFYKTLSIRSFDISKDASELASDVDDGYRSPSSLSPFIPAFAFPLIREHRRFANPFRILIHLFQNPSCQTLSR